MSIQFITKDVTDVDVGIIAHGVNCQGKMNSGVAKAIRAKWPKVFERYEIVCKFHKDDRKKMLGMVHLVDVGEKEGQLYVANCFTQEFYGADGRKYADVGAVKEAFMTLYQAAVVLSLPLLMPRIGCGLGGLDWDGEVGVVLASVDEHFNYCNLGNPDVYVCDWK